jgi:serine/threonine protein kinase
MVKAFARKLLHIPHATWESIKREADAINKLSENGGHTHIVNVLRLGQLGNSDYYFIDMELCDLNLDVFINSWTSREGLPFFVRDRPPPLKAQQIWNVMIPIACGTEYIHSLELVHRDLKPANSMSLSTFG